MGRSEMETLASSWACVCHTTPEGEMLCGQEEGHKEPVIGALRLSESEKILPLGPGGETPSHVF